MKYFCIICNKEIIFNQNKHVLVTNEDCPSFCCGWECFDTHEELLDYEEALEDYKKNYLY